MRRMEIDGLNGQIARLCDKVTNCGGLRRMYAAVIQTEQDKPRLPALQRKRVQFKRVQYALYISRLKIAGNTDTCRGRDVNARKAGAECIHNVLPFCIEI